MYMKIVEKIRRRLQNQQVDSELQNTDRSNQDVLNQLCRSYENLYWLFDSKSHSEHIERITFLTENRAEVLLSDGTPLIVRYKDPYDFLEQCCRAWPDWRPNL